MPYEFPKWVVDGATVLAFIFAALPFVISPESTNKAIPKFFKRFRGVVALTAIMAFLWLLQKQPFMHGRIPVWGAVDGAVGVLVLFALTLRVQARRISVSRSKQLPIPQASGVRAIQVPAASIPQAAKPKQLEVPNYVDLAGMRWPISYNTVYKEPICGKCNRKLNVTSTMSYSPLKWDCKQCNITYEWNSTRDGDPQDAAAEIVNSKFRANDQIAPVKGYHKYF